MTLEDHTEEISNSIFEFSGEYAATSSLDKTVRLWDLRQVNCLKCFDDHSDEVLDIAFNPTGTLLTSASADG